jgi:hypothetical protein
MKRTLQTLEIELQSLLAMVSTKHKTEDFLPVSISYFGFSALISM